MFPKDVELPGATKRSQSGLNSFTVRHMSLLSWPNGRPFPSDNSTLLQLVQQASLAQHRAPDAKVLVQCTCVLFSGLSMQNCVSGVEHDVLRVHQHLGGFPVIFAQGLIKTNFMY